MNREETKKKLVEELKKEMAPIEYGGDREHAPEVHYPTEEEIAEALIEAGLRFTESLTATFNKMDLLREHQLVCRLANAEHRAEVAEMALDLCETAYILSLNHRATEGISGQAIASDFGIHKFFMKQARLAELKGEKA